MLWLAAVVALGGGVPSLGQAGHRFTGVPVAYGAIITGVPVFVNPFFQTFFKNFSQVLKCVVIAMGSGIIEELYKGMPLHLTMRRQGRSIDGTMREHRHAIGAKRSNNQGDGLGGGVVNGRRWSDGK